MKRLLEASLFFAVLLLGAGCQPDVEPPEPDEPIVPNMGATTAGGEATEEPRSKELE